MRLSWRFHRRWNCLFLLLIGVAVLGAWPVRPVQAVLVNQTLDDTLEDFTTGTFQRTGLSSLQVNSSEPDLVGAVQLGRSGQLKPWRALTLPLPQKLTDIGAVALGNRIYVIGGNTGASNTNTVYWTQVNPENGTPTDPNDPNSVQPWRNDDPLPAIQANDFSGSDADCTTPVAERSGAAVAALSSGNNGGYIYVVGGSVRPSGCIFSVSSYAVQIGAVNASTGRVSWSAAPPLPEYTPGNRDGVQFAQATVIDTGNKAFLYVIGGWRRYLTGLFGASPNDRGSTKVYYAEINRSNGSLGDWNEAAELPIPAEAGADAGLWRATTVGGYFDGGGSGGYAIYVTGGRQAFGGLAEYNTTVFRARVDPNTGALTWSDAIGPPGKEKAVINESRIGMSAVELNGKLYMIGGEQPTETRPAALRRSVLTTYVEDNLSLPSFGAGAEQLFFIESLNVIDARTNHASVVVPATPKPDEPSAAWVYVIGGTDVDGATDRVYYGKIGGVDESDVNELAPTGWFYSQPFSIQINNSNTEVQEIRWTTVVTRTGLTDIQLSYRVAVTTALCDGPEVFAGSDWRDLDGVSGDPTFRSQNGVNVVVFEGVNKPPPSSCLQYRARFVTSNKQESPVLLNVSIKKFVPGGPDLKPVENPVVPQLDGDGKLTNLTVTIINQNLFEPPTQPVDFARPGKNESFFVDLCISVQNGTVTPPPSKEGKDPACSKVYANIAKSAVPLESPYTIPASVWLDNTTNQPISPLSYFTEPGDYQVVVVIDGQNLVQEGDGPASQNNVSQVVSFTVTGSTEPPPPPPDGPGTVLVPIVLRQ